MNKKNDNAFTHHIQGASRMLSSGHDLIELWSPPGLHPKVWVNDLQDFYPSFISSREKAATNVIDAEFRFGDLVSFKAAREFKKLNPAAHAGTKVVVGLRSLAQGDRNAVDWAEEAHANILSSGGAYQESQRVNNRRTFPRGLSVQLLQIDDHVGIAMGSRSRPDEWTQMDSTFRLAETAVSAAGLSHHPSKKVKRADSAVALGAEINGKDGWLSLIHI